MTEFYTFTPDWSAFEPRKESRAEGIERALKSWWNSMLYDIYTRDMQ